MKCLWTIADAASDDVQEVWPDGCLELMFTGGNTFRVNEDGSSQRFPRTFIVGLQSGIMRVRAEGELQLLGVRMLPFMLRDLRPTELESVADEIEPLLRASRFPEAVRIVEAWLLRQPKVETP